MADAVRELRADGHGQARLATGELAPPGPRQARVRVVASGYSLGTERHMLAAGYRGRLGYSAAGVVEAVGAEVDPHLVGRGVAVYGAPHAGHADRLTVPLTLAAPLPPGEDPGAYAGAGLGAIALHALRLGRLEMGASVLVAGLGAIGQWLVGLALAGGARVLAVDPRPERIDLARVQGAAAVGTLDALGDELVDHERLDLVLAAMGSEDPGIARQLVALLPLRGRLVVVGDLPLDLDREALFQREASVVVSRAGGPGRYDPVHEAQGHDYPVAYVRWTEGRNLGAVVDLVHRRRIRPQAFETHRFTPATAGRAYAARDAVGAILSWDEG